MVIVSNGTDKQKKEELDWDLKEFSIVKKCWLKPFSPLLISLSHMIWLRGQSKDTRWVCIGMKKRLWLDLQSPAHDSTGTALEGKKAANEAVFYPT